MSGLFNPINRFFSRHPASRLLPLLLITTLLLLFTARVYASSPGEGGAGGHGAEAAHGGGESPERLKDLLYRSMNFIIFFGVLFFLLRKPLKQNLADRRNNIQKELEELETQKASARQELEGLTQRIARMKEEKEAILAEYRAEGEKEKQKIIDNAQKTAARLLEQTQVTIQQEIQKANQTLRQEIAESAVRMAEEILRKNITDNDHKVLIGEYLAKVVTH